MFYDKLLQICKEYDVKPTPVLKELGISPGNLKRWENGATVNSDTLTKIADYFHVPTDYFFSEDDIEVDESIIGNNNSVAKIYYVLKAYPDYIASLMSSDGLTADQLKTVAAYINCSVEYLLKDSGTKPTGKGKLLENTFFTPKELVLEILTRLAGSTAYRAVQVNISRIIINNLAKLNISRDNLIDINLAKKKITDLYSERSAGTICGLNNSDLLRISHKYSISFDFMFTGQN